MTTQVVQIVCQCPPQSQGSAVVDRACETSLSSSLSSSMLVTSMADGTSSSAMLLTGQGPGSDAIVSMAVPRGDRNQI